VPVDVQSFLDDLPNLVTEARLSLLNYHQLNVKVQKRSFSLLDDARICFVHNSL
jgi:hypothetical protein